jgi:two-component system, cell cycle sensor histidine kinase and response regulator CckA
MIKLDLARESKAEMAHVETHPAEETAPEDAGGESLFNAMRGALRRTAHTDLSGVGFFIVKPRKREKEALSLLSAIFESSTDAIIGLTLDGTIATWNRGAERCLGFIGREAAGHHLSLFARDGGDQDLMDALAKLKHGSRAVELEVTAVARDGRKLLLSVTLSAIADKRGKPAAATLVGRDITEHRRGEMELRKSEEWYRALVEESADLIVVLERDGRIRSVNSSLRRLLGYRLGDIAGNNPLQWIHADDLGTLTRAAHQFLELETSEPVCVRVRHSDGSWRTIEATARNLLDDADIGGIIINARDISSRAQGEEQLRATYGHAQRMEAVERLSGVIAHDLDNLLTIICGYTGLIIDQVSWGRFEQDRLLEDAQHIRKAADDVAVLAERLLVFGQKQLMRPRVLDINSVIASVDGAVRRLLGENIKLVTMLDPEAGRVKADQKQIERAIMSIAANAREAMSHGGTLTIETTNTNLTPSEKDSINSDKSGRYVVLSIRDTGTGIDPQTQSRMFEPFFTTKEDDSHRGVGLSIAHGIVKQCGGTISVCSEPGVGTSFRICLPRADVAAEAVLQSESEQLPRGTETVLLQLDEDLRALAREVLTASGYTVLEARDPNQALHLCETHSRPIDLLLTDTAGSASEIIGRLSSLRPELKLLCLYGYTEDGPLPGAVYSGWSFIEKPFTPAALLRKTREVLDEKPQARAQPA